jgi:hypothetical protein
MSNNLNSELKKEENYTRDQSKRGVKGSSGALGRGPYMQYPKDVLVVMHVIMHHLS